MDQFLRNLELMIWPAVMCLVVTSMLGYLGLHVLSRKVIFVDLALAQIAAVGGIFAQWLGYDAHPGVPEEPSTLRVFEIFGLSGVSAPPDAVMIYLFSLGFALVGAAVFALTRMRHERVPQEAFIGISFATAAAVALLLVRQLRGESEHLRGMLVREGILTISAHEVLVTAVVFGVIGFIHYVFRQRFLRISLDPEGAAAEGWNLKAWDFLFYGTFGFVITSSVQISGVLLVFTFLVVPASVAMLAADSIRARILVAWGVGFAASLTGIVITSAQGHLPLGPVIIAVFAGTLIVTGLARYVMRSPSRLRAASNLALGVLVAASVGAVGWLARKEHVHTHDPGSDPILLDLASGEEIRQRQALHRVLDTGDPHHYVEAVIRLADAQPPDTILEEVIKALGRMGDARAVPALVRIGESHDESDLGLVAAEALEQLRDPAALGVALHVAERAQGEYVREQGLELLRRLTGRDEGAPEAWRAWWEANAGRLRWNAGASRFE